MYHLLDLINRAPTSLSSRFRSFWMRLCGAKIGHRCRFERIRWRQADQLEIGKYVAITHGTFLYPMVRNPERPGVKIRLGNHVFLNAYCFLDAGLNITLEDGVMVGPYTYITDGDHGTENDKGVWERPMHLAPVLFREGAWIGAHCCILRGVTIGRYAIVGAGAVVTQDVPDNEKVAGVPAKLLETFQTTGTGMERKCSFR